MTHLETRPQSAVPAADASRLKLSFGGGAVREIREAAASLGVTPPRFVAKAVKQALQIHAYRQRGYTPILRDDRGVEVDIDF